MKLIHRKLFRSGRDLVSLGLVCITVGISRIIGSVRLHKPRRREKESK